jgi:hypothetical protein
MSDDKELKLVVCDDGYGNYRLVVIVDGYEAHTDIESQKAKDVAYRLATLLVYLAKLEDIR